MVRRLSGSSILLGWALSTLALPAPAADLSVPPPLPTFVAPAPVTSPYGILSEARLGLSAHGVYTREFGSVDVNGELLTVRPYTFGTFWDYFIPKFHLGGDLNTDGKTSEVYAGITWQFPLYQRFFGELTFGGSYNDGHTGLVVSPEFSHVGCHELFRESAALGYHLTEHWNIIAIAEHNSNAGLCKHNEGLTNIGARLGYVF